MSVARGSSSPEVLVCSICGLNHEYCWRFQFSPCPSCRGRLSTIAELSDGCYSEANQILCGERASALTNAAAEERSVPIALFPPNLGADRGSQRRRDLNVRRLRSTAPADLPRFEDFFPDSFSSQED